MKEPKSPQSGGRFVPPPLPSNRLIEDKRVFSRAVTPLLTPELSNKVREIALADKQVSALLGLKRCAQIGATLVQEGAMDRTPIVKYVFYLYEGDTVIEVSVNPEKDVVINVEQCKYQPALTTEELSRAVALAAKDHRLAKRIEEEALEGRGIRISRRDPADPRFGHRLADVRFGLRDSRLPLLMAIVDLSTNTVVTAGLVKKGEESRDE